MGYEEQLKLTSLMVDAERRTELLFKQTGKTVEELLLSGEQGWRSPAFWAIAAAFELDEFIESEAVSEDEFRALWNAVTTDDVERMRGAVKLEYGRCPHSDHLLQTIVMNNKVHRLMVDG